LTLMPETFLPAIADAIRTTSKHHTRIGLTRVVLRGKGGEIVASDSRQLVQRGFPFPWADDVLIPRLPALDGRPLDVTGPAGIGRTAEHVVIRVAPWAFALPIDTDNPFPAIEAVIPRASAATGRLRLDPEEAIRLAAVLPHLPGAGDEQAPVTLSLERRPTIRAKGEADSQAVEVVLDRSTVDGSQVTVATDRTYLLRALALGFTEVQAGPTNRAVVCRDRRRIYLWMPLEATAAIPAGPNSKRIPLPPAEPSAVAVPSARPRSAIAKVAVPSPATNGHSPRPAHGDEQTGRVTVGDVIGEAVAVGSLLRDAAGRVTRLVTALRRQRGQTRAVQQAVRSLKQFQFDH
jgi:hypothetical protein